MPKKEKSPIGEVQREGDVMKKKVDSFATECQKHVNDPKADRNTTKEHFKRCRELQFEVKTLNQKVSKLKEENELIKVDNYKDKLKDEVRRIESMNKTLDTFAKSLKNISEVNTPAYAKTNNDQMQKVGVEVEETDESEDDSEGEDEDEDEEESEEDEDEETVDSEAVTGEDDGESEEDDEEDDDEEEESESASEEETASDGSSTVGFGAGTNQLYEAISDFEGKNPGDLTITEGEVLTILDPRVNGWWLAENAEAEKGVVPVTYLQICNKYKSVEQQQDEEEDEEPKTPKSPRALWKNIKQAVKETSATDVLQALGAVPAGFRESTLGKLREKEEYSLKFFLTPKLSPSCLGYRDLFYDNAAAKIRSRASRILRVVTIQGCRQIPPPGTGVEINSRHVRVCLFDGQNMLSNVHTMRCMAVDKEQRAWNFNTRADMLQPGITFAEFFVRSTQTNSNIGLLFELCVSYTRSSTGQAGEFSCGWVHLPLFDNEGQPAPNKTFDLHVNGGTPFEKGVEVDPSAGRKAGASMFRSLMAGNRQPRLSVRLQQPTREQKDLLDTLPDVCLASTTYIQYLSFYRQLLTDALLRDTDDVMCIEPIHSPVLNMFPEVADQPDLMDMLRGAWSDRMKTAKRVEKRDSETMKEMFKKVFMETIYPLAVTASLPAFKFADLASEKSRLDEMERLSKLNAASAASKLPVPACLLAATTLHAPFDISEIAFSVIGDFHSATPQAHYAR